MFAFCERQVTLCHYNDKGHVIVDTWSTVTC